MAKHLVDTRRVRLQHFGPTRRCEGLRQLKQAWIAEPICDDIHCYSCRRPVCGGLSTSRPRRRQQVVDKPGQANRVMEVGNGRGPVGDVVTQGGIHPRDIGCGVRHWGAFNLVHGLRPATGHLDRQRATGQTFPGSVCLNGGTAASRRPPG